MPGLKFHYLALLITAETFDYCKDIPDDNKCNFDTEISNNLKTIVIGDQATKNLENIVGYSSWTYDSHYNGQAKVKSDSVTFLISVPVKRRAITNLYFSLFMA